MRHIKVTVPSSSQEQKDILVALLSEAGYEGFEENESDLAAYIAEPGFDEEGLKAILGSATPVYRSEIIPSQNWNEIWESNFQPVVVDDFCTIRADFHNITVTTPYEIVITPKMSFGTGHHATTRLVMTCMKSIDFRGKSVLDFGTGTGVLAILAEKLGARRTLAIDIDEWPVENAIENAGRNNCEHIEVRLGSIEDIGDFKADVLLANINRHILLKYMSIIYKAINEGGHLIISGILIEDESVMQQAATEAGFRFCRILEDSGWAAMQFEK